MTDEERLWWAVLVLADADSERAGKNGRGEDGPSGREETLFPHYIGGKARVALRDKFGHNLDTLFAKAKERYEDLYAAEHAKIASEKERRAELDALLGRLPVT